MLIHLKHNWIIGCILIIAIYLRFTGINPGYPTEHPDEGAYHSALLMIAYHNYDPQRYDYPSGMPLIMYALFNLILLPLYKLSFTVSFYLDSIGDQQYKLPFNDSYRYFVSYLLSTHQNTALYWGRYITALLGVGSVLMVYLLSKKIFGQPSAYLASFLIAINFRQVLNSHIGLPDVFNAFFLLIAVFYLIRLLHDPSLKNYLAAGVTSALYFCIKFQIFTILPLVLIQLYLTYNRSYFKTNFLRLWIRFALCIGAIILIVVCVNPYHLMHFDKFKDIQTYQLSKYGSGSFQLSLYSYAYLFHHGIGQLLSIMVIFGVVISYYKKPLIATIVLSVIIQFLFVFTFYSRGGFYTRNFVTITPLILIFAGVAIHYFSLFIHNNLKINYYLVLILLLAISSYANIQRSIIVANEYSKPWNADILYDWLEQNIPKSSIIASHKTVPMPKDLQRLDYDINNNFSMDEFTESSNVDYAITNFVWATGGFYWWINTNPSEFWQHYWNKPTSIMEYSYPALAIRELEPFVVFSVFNSWLAPEADFMVAKIPKYSVSDKMKYITYSFQNSSSGWRKVTTPWAGDNLDYSDGLIVKNKDARIPNTRWESPIIPVENWPGFIIDYLIISQTTKDIPAQSHLKAGYVFASFYTNAEDAQTSQNRIGVRLSSRNNTANSILNKTLAGLIPINAKFMTISFYSYDTASSISILKHLMLSKAVVSVDYNNVQVYPIKIDDNNLFPNSHGNL